jgi:hypothetical protein
MKYVSFLWPPVVAAQDLRGLYEYCIAAEVISSRSIILLLLSASQPIVGLYSQPFRGL